MVESCMTNQETKECKSTQIGTAKKITSKKKTRHKNKKFRSVNTQIPGKPRSMKMKMHEPAESNSEKDI